MKGDRFPRITLGVAAVPARWVLARLKRSNRALVLLADMVMPLPLDDASDVEDALTPFLSGISATSLSLMYTIYIFIL